MDHQGDSTGTRKNPLVYNGHVIADRGDDLCLTDMWKACGAPTNKEPWNWTRKEGSSFIAAVAIGHNLTVGQVIKSKKGKGGSTFAHWQAGMAYAQYLDHDFHMWCNTAAREKMEGKGSAVALSESDRNTIGGIVKACTSVVFREQLLEILPAMIETTVQARLADQALLIRRGEPALTIWNRFNLPDAIRGRSQWLGYRLIQFGCALTYGERADVAGNAIRLFDPDKANFAMKNGLLATARQWANEKLGQGKFKI